jgi:sugar lactone lactonase YvrE
MAVGPDGQMVITDAGYNVLYLFDRGGTMRAVIDLNSPGNMRVGSADGVAVDALGNIYFSDRLYHTVQKFVPAPPTPANPTSWGRVKGLYR